jgi:hypothetical protein
VGVPGEPYGAICATAGIAAIAVKQVAARAHLVADLMLIIVASLHVRSCDNETSAVEVLFQ